jgi:DNA repair protein RadD
VQLRQYQLEAVEAVYKHLRERTDNPCVVIPTGGGKTPVFGKICQDFVNYGKRACILAPSQELLLQASDKLTAFDVPHGIYSAGLNRRDTKQPVIVAGIQSIYERAADFEPFDIVIPDEAQGIPPDGEGRYLTFLRDCRTINPNVRFVGMTATPFRMTSGPICTPEGMLNKACFEAGVRQLIVNGYLCPLISKRGKKQADTSGLHIRGGEYIASEVESLFDTDELVEAACAEICELAGNRKSILIFCAGVDHANDVGATLSTLYGLTCKVVTGDTPDDERAQAVADFRSGALQCLVNVNIFTVGFDAPNVDCVVLLRATLSPGLYCQMVGRGLRLSPGKADCLVLDYGRNVKEHGPIDNLRLRDRPAAKGGEAPSKECPECRWVGAAGYSKCPICGYDFAANSKPPHGAIAANDPILAEVKTIRHEVQDTFYSVHVKRGAPPEHPRTMRVDYQISPGVYQSEWICLEHRDEFAYPRACQWWRKRSPDPIPANVEDAVTAAKNGALAETKAVTVKHKTGDKYGRIESHELGEMPAPLGEYVEPVTQEGLAATPF